MSCRSYDEIMSLWKVDYDEEWVETEYGRPYIITAGKEDNPPLLLIPGLFGDATMWYANAGALSEKYRIYALDLITFDGKSEPAGRMVKTEDDYVLWFRNILDHYGFQRVAGGGLSFGSWLSLMLAQKAEDRVGAAVLIDPSETFIKMDGGIAWKGFWSFAFFPTRDKQRAFFDWMGG